MYLPVMPSASSRTRFLGLLLFGAAASFAATIPVPHTSVRTDHARAELVSAVTSIAPRDSFTVALRLRPDSGWHVYWSNPGDAGMPPALTWTLPRDWTATPLRFPVPRRQDVPPFASFGYEREVWYPAKVFAGGEDGGHRALVRARAEWLICREECLPESADFTLVLGGAPTRPHPEHAARLQEFALARLPRPQPDWDWRVAYDDTTVTLSWDRAAARAEPAGDGEVFFFPAEIGVLVHAAPQVLELTEGRARLVMRRDDILQAQPDTLRGVIVFGAGDEAARRGYELALTAGLPGTPSSSWRSGLLVAALALAALVLIIVLKRPHVDGKR